MAIDNVKTAAIRPESTARPEPIKNSEPIQGSKQAAVREKVETAPQPEAAAPVKSQAEIEKSIQDTVTELNQASQKYSRNLEFSVDDSSGKTIITVTDRETEKVVRQIPSEEVLAIAERVESIRGNTDKNAGLLINLEA